MTTNTLAAELGTWWYCAVWQTVRPVPCARAVTGHESCGPVEVKRVEEEDE